MLEEGEMTLREFIKKAANTYYGPLEGIEMCTDNGELAKNNNLQYEASHPYKFITLTEEGEKHFQSVLDNKVYFSRTPRWLDSYDFVHVSPGNDPFRVQTFINWQAGYDILPRRYILTFNTNQNDIKYWFFGMSSNYWEKEIPELAKKGGVKNE